MVKNVYFCNMLQFENQKIKHIVRKALPVIALVAILYSCASIGRPEGGPKDYDPPRFVGSTPAAGAINNKRTKVSLQFDEFIKLEKATEKVVVSPPQIQQPEIKASGKKIQVNLLDSLKPNTTYTIDFSDAIVDNNEGNPLGNFAFTFSTGAQIDTMEVSGTVLDASNLEPIKGILVGLHANLNDSAFTKLPFDRVARTDSRGRFSIRGVAPGKYRIFGLMDSDQNFAFTQKSEVIAFNEYFDTQVDDVIISHNSLNGLYIDNYLAGSVSDLDHRISNHQFEEDELLEVNHKRKVGKTQKYSLGTIFVNNDYLLTAFSKFDDKNRAFLTMPDYLAFLINFWDKVNRIYAQKSVSVPIFGSGITRIKEHKNISDEDLLKIMLWTFRISEMRFKFPAKLTIVIHKDKIDKINLLDIKSARNGL